MKPRTLVIAMVAFLVALAFVAQRRASNPAIDQYGQIDALYAQVSANPTAYPREVCSATKYIGLALKAGTVYRGEFNMKSSDEPAILQMLQKQATPEQIRARDTWKKAGYDVSQSLQFARESLGLNKEEADRIGRKYDAFTRNYFGAPTVGLRHPPSGGDEFYIVEPGPVTSDATRSPAPPARHAKPTTAAPAGPKK